MLKNNVRHDKKKSFSDFKSILSILSENITPVIELEAGFDAYILLVSVVLSAQATDISVNKVLPKLFNKHLNFAKSFCLKCKSEGCLNSLESNVSCSSVDCNFNDLFCSGDKSPVDNINYIYPLCGKYFINKKSVDHIKSMSVEEIESKIKTIGLYRNKARNIKALTDIIVEEHEYKIPSNIIELQKLPGVGRKSANIMLNVVFNQPAVPVDTHVFRVAGRIGLSSAKTRDKVELDILAYFKGKKNSCDLKLLKDLHFYFVLHGRYTCIARKPKCDSCPIKRYCNFYNTVNKNQ